MTDNKNKIKILVVDDTPENIDVLDGILSEKYKVIVSLNGPTALKLAKEKQPDLILLDVMMPGMDGYEVCEKLKQDNETKKIPVIFVTAKTEIESEIKGFSLGAVDYITKPISPPIVEARVDTHLKIQSLMMQLEKDKQIVEEANKQMLHEQEMAKSIYDKMVKKGSLDKFENIKHVLNPMDIFAGDLLLANKGPDGSTYLLLGDFTGHGLTASVGVMPTTEIFYNMSGQGYSLGTIMKTINNKLNQSLPIGIFCAACAIQFSPNNNLLTLWNGWNPEALLVDKTGTIKHKFESKHMPLALQKPEKFSAELDAMFLEPGDRLLMYTDGITEAKAENGDMFGTEKIEAVFSDHKDPNTFFEEILDRVIKFRGNEPQSDDVTMVEFYNKEELEKDNDKKDKDENKKE